MDSSCDFKDVKLEYFGLNGRAAVIRALLYWKQVPFTDVKHTFEDWAKLKKSGDYEFEQLPSLECCGKRYVQSGSIILFLARKMNLLGSTPDEEYLQTSQLYSLEDLIPKYGPAYFAWLAGGEANMEIKRKEFNDVFAPFYLKVQENRFKKYGGKYAVGDSFSLSDVILTVMLTTIFKSPSKVEIMEPMLNEFAPTLAKHIANIAKNELAEYFAKGFIEQAPL